MFETFRVLRPVLLSLLNISSDNWFFAARKIECLFLTSHQDYHVP